MSLQNGPGPMHPTTTATAAAVAAPQTVHHRTRKQYRRLSMDQLSELPILSGNTVSRTDVGGGGCPVAAAELVAAAATSGEHRRAMAAGVTREQILADRKLLQSTYHQSLLKVSWKLIENEVLKKKDSFDLGHDIQTYYSLYQGLTLEDLAKANRSHTVKGIMKVVSKVLCHLNDLSRVEDYLRVVGRLHDSAGVEIAYLAVTGDAFCTSLKRLGTHADIWNDEVKQTWNAFFRVVVDMMSAGYTLKSSHKLMSNVIENKNYISEVWVTFQDNVLHYLSNTLLLPLVIRSNRTISRYFVSYESTVANLCFEGSMQAVRGNQPSSGCALNGGGCPGAAHGVGGAILPTVREPTPEEKEKFSLTLKKHATLFLTGILSRLIPNLDSLDVCEEYLRVLGKKHRVCGVRAEHLDLLAVVYCHVIRGVMASQGVRGGPLGDLTRAWLNFLRYIVAVMKTGYEC